jgi:microsomal triglyceride transfer protein large subunit
LPHASKLHESIQRIREREFRELVCVQIIGEVKASLVDGLSTCANEECKQKYLRALKNLGLKDTVPVLLQHSLFGTRKTSVTAMKALRSLPPASWDNSVKKAAAQIYYQLGRRYDSSARTLAADILLESEPSHDILRELLLSLAKRADPAYEVSEPCGCRKCLLIWSLPDLPVILSSACLAE